MSEHLETAFPQKRHRIAQQTDVLKRSAAEADAVQAMRSTKARAGGGDYARHREVESRGDFAGRDAIDHVTDNRLDGGPQIDLKGVARFDRERVLSGGFCCRHLQFNGGLPFVRDFVPNAEQRRYGIEEASARGCLDCLNVFGDHRIHHPNLLRRNIAKNRKRQRQCVFAERLAQPGKRTAPGSPHCAVAAGKRHILQMAAAFEIPEIANEEFASPYLAVRPIPCAIERHPNNPAFDSVGFYSVGFYSVFCHATRYVRVVVLDADGRQTGLAKRKPRAQIVRMQIVRDRDGRDPEETA